LTHEDSESCGEYPWWQMAYSNGLMLEASDITLKFIRHCQDQDGRPEDFR
jgi:hypothetical protein